MERNKCIYCNKELSEFGKYHVCHNCKMVVFNKGMPFDEKQAAIDKFLGAMHAKRLAKQDELHDLEQRHMSKVEFTPEEKEIYENACEFQSIYSELSQIDKWYRGGDEDSRMKIKKLLYRLLMISDWLETY